ncbi:MAG: hypothetical protein RID15_14020 [Marinovum algicola]|uniref:hypothetical protein n=1 Tax=Marinovum algicola TaxID=42444 RepID=UPI0032ED019E
MDFAELVLARLDELGHNINSFEASRGWPQGFLRAVVRSDGKRTVPNIERAKTICEALGLDFYIGPPRETDWSVRPANMKNAGDAQYASVPFDPRGGSSGGRPPIAFLWSWFRNHELDPTDACLVNAPDDDMAPSVRVGDLLMLDRGFAPSREPTLCAFNVDAQLKVGWLTAPSPNSLVGFYQRAYTPPAVRAGRDGPLIECLGRIVLRIGEHVGPWLDVGEKLRMAEMADDLVKARKSK